MARVIDMDTYIKKREKMKTLENKTFSELAGNIVKMLKKDGNGAKYTPKQAARIADEILKISSKVGYDSEMATPIIKIINGFGIDIRRTKKMPKGNAGVIYAGGNTEEIFKSDVIIITDSNEPFEHQRFIIAHELAHYLFDYVGNHANREVGCEVSAFKETYPRENHSSEREVRANRFAAELLMPLKLFVEQYNYAMEKSDNRIYTIKYLAKYFQVKEASVEKRIYEVLYNGGY